MSVPNTVQKTNKSTDNIPSTELILPKLSLYEWLHTYRLPWTTQEKKEEARSKLMEQIHVDEMLPFYLELCEEFGWDKDQTLIEKLEAANNEELKRIEAAYADAVENYGDVEIRDCCLTKANFYCRIGDLKNVFEAYELAQSKSVGAGGKLNITLTLIRIGLFNRMKEVTKKYIASAKKECVKGGDWEKRNKLKVYEALFLAELGRFEEAADLLYSCVAIFTATEIIRFDAFIYLTIVLAMATFDRPSMNTKIMSSPEIAQVLEENRIYKDFLHSFYHCQFDQFMVSLVRSFSLVREDRYLMNHAHYFVRKIRFEKDALTDLCADEPLYFPTENCSRKAYQQYLNPYSSVHLHSMAKAFRVSEEFLEDDLVEYIVNDKLGCKIDLLKGVIVCTRRVALDDLHIEAIKQGDILLEKLQKVSKIIDM